MPRHGYALPTPDWNELSGGWLTPLRMSDVRALTLLATAAKTAENEADFHDCDRPTKTGLAQIGTPGVCSRRRHLPVVHSDIQRRAQMPFPQSVRDAPCASPQSVTASSRVLPFAPVTLSPEDRLRALRDVDPETAMRIDSLIDQMYEVRCAAQR